MRLTLIACLMGAAAAAVDAQRGAPSSILYFQGARLITGESRPPIDDAAVIVEGDRVTQVGSRASLRVPAGATVIDVRDKTIIPALVDAHSHLGYTDVRAGDTAASHYTRENLQAATRSATEIARNLTGPEKLKSLQARETMMPFDRIESMPVADATPLRDIIGFLKQRGRQRLPIFGNDRTVRFIVP